MENHPIPQDVTGFKFKLIGSITVKQFLYLLGFGILTTVAFVLKVNIFVKVPLMLLFASIGAALAFLPIEGRPMDIMLMNFIRALPSENRYLYRKRGVNLSKYVFLDRSIRPVAAPVQKTQTTTSTAEASNEDKRAILISRLRNSGLRPDESETRTLNNIKTFFEDSSGKSNKSQINQAKLAEVYSGNIVSQTVTPSAQKIVEPPKPIVRVTEEQSKPPDQTMVQMAQKEAEEKVKSELANKNTFLQVQTPPEPTSLKLSETKTTSQGPKIDIPQSQMGWAPSNSLPGGFPSLPDVANVVLGLVRDSRGKTLPNILVEVVDVAGIPVRAFKTNALGQFASATPLSNGTYKIHFEDPNKQHEIAPIDINLTGEIFQPVEAISVDDREKLRRELFGGAAPNA
jgi:hypothetical protein